MDFYKTSKEEKLFAEFKVRKHYEEIEILNNMYLQLITEMILCDKIQIQNLPFGLRISHRTFYITAFRVSGNISAERFMDDVMLLYNDINKDIPCKKDYMRILLSSLDYYDFRGDEKFETDKTNISKEILFKLSNYKTLISNQCSRFYSKIKKIINYPIRLYLY